MSTVADRDIEHVVDAYASTTGPVRLAIVGSVTFTHQYDWHQNGVVIRRVLVLLKPEQLISGGAPGLDTLVEQIGGEYGYTEAAGSLLVFRPAVKRWSGEGGFKARNIRIAEACTHLLRVWCQSSRTYGSGWTADEAQRLGRQVVRYSPCFASSGAPGDLQPDLFSEAGRVG